MVDAADHEKIEAARNELHRYNLYLKSNHTESGPFPGGRKGLRDFLNYIKGYKGVKLIL